SDTCEYRSAAWNWLIENNPLYEDYVAVDRVGLQGEIVRDVREADPRHFPAREVFGTTILRQLDPGPRAGDFNLENINIGMEDNDNENELVNFKNPKLLAKIFPKYKQLVCIVASPPRAHGE
ncbi:hypothetical protein BGZ65_011727, partial [Modicella reniformis]